MRLQHDDDITHIVIGVFHVYDIDIDISKTCYK